MKRTRKGSKEIRRSMALPAWAVVAGGVVTLLYVSRSTEHGGWPSLVPAPGWPFWTWK